MFNKEQLGFLYELVKPKLIKNPPPKKNNQYHCPFTFAFAMKIIYNVMYDIYACTMTGFDVSYLEI